MSSSAAAVVVVGSWRCGPLALSPLPPRPRRTQSRQALQASSSKRQAAVCVLQNSKDKHEEEDVASGAISRRQAAVTLAAAAAALATGTPSSQPYALAEGEITAQVEDALAEYTDAQLGFSVRYPSSWEKKDKAGANVLFVDPAAKSNTIGVVIRSLDEFGSVDDVADKLLAAERRKASPTTHAIISIPTFTPICESTREATMLRVLEKAQPSGGPKQYLYEYFMDTTRGMKNTLTAVTIANKKLYILNVVYAVKAKVPPAADNLGRQLEKVLNSLEVRT
eukprot:jgi/Chlat1/4769/Chrsp308S04741